MPAAIRRLYWFAFLATRVLWQSRYSYASLGRIERDRDRNLRKMVRHAYRWVPYYRATFARLGLKPGDIRTFDDLRKLPLISVEDLQRDPEAFQSTYRPQDRRVPETSSGSTGSPHTIWHDSLSIYSNVVDAERERRMHQKLIDKGWRYSSVFVGGHSPSRTVAASRAGTFWPGWLSLRRARISDTVPLPEVVEFLNRTKPDLLGGFGSTLGELFMHVEATGVPLHRPVLLRYVSDELSPTVREMIEHKYGIPVYSGYQTSEAYRLGWECEAHEGYHINVDHYPTRLVDEDGEDVAEGEVGEVVVSNLTNRGTVLLNYRQGDLAQRIDAPCPCGRHLPRIGNLQGRANDWFLDEAGDRVSYRMIERMIRVHEPIWQWQAIQEAPDRVVFRLRLAPGSDVAAATDVVAGAVRQWLGASVRAEVLIVDEIAHTAAGKLRHMINKLLT